jgi:hypothetical protein
MLSYRKTLQNTARIVGDVTTCTAFLRLALPWVIDRTIIRPFAGLLYST